MAVFVGDDGGRIGREDGIEATRSNVPLGVSHAMRDRNLDCLVAGGQDRRLLHDRLPAERDQHTIVEILSAAIGRAGKQTEVERRPSSVASAGEASAAVGSVLVESVRQSADPGSGCRVSFTLGRIPLPVEVVKTGIETVCQEVVAEVALVRDRRQCLLGRAGAVPSS